MKVRINKLKGGKIVSIEKSVPDNIAKAQLSLPRERRNASWRDVEIVEEEEKRTRKTKEGGAE